MTIKEYIDKNLPSLNWNILPQIFEANDVELTEEIGKYLKETPWNTNWNILKQFSGSGSKEGKLLFDEIINCWDDDGGESSYVIGTAEYKPTYIPSKITIIFDDKIYENIDMTVYDHSYNIQGYITINDDTLAYITMQVAKSSGGITNMAVAAQQSGNHHVIVYDVS